MKLTDKTRVKIPKPDKVDIGTRCVATVRFKNTNAWCDVLIVGCSREEVLTHPFVAFTAFPQAIHNRLALEKVVPFKGR